MNENEFAYRVRQALNEGVEQLDYTTIYRLEQARKLAVAAHRVPSNQVATIELPIPQFHLAGATAVSGGSGQDRGDSGSWGWAQRLGLIAPIFAVIAGFVGVHEWQSDQAITERAALDFAVLLDDFPIDTYSEKGFGTLLKDGQFGI